MKRKISPQWIYKNNKTPIYKYDERKSIKTKVKTYKDYLKESKK